jgi:aryl-alcohol dehydrogenase-like predicted oxidoreductase
MERVMTQRRRLGTTDMEISSVGLGSWAIGGGGWAMSWGAQDDNASIAAIQHAVGCGINWVDTAPVYGHGHSEEVVGRAVAGLPASQRPFIFTKCGLIWDERDHYAEPRNILRPESIRKECEASLRRLGVERIDLLQFHWPDTSGVPAEESWGAMLELIDEGKVRAGGVSNYGVDLLERCAAVGHVDSVQPPFSLIRREAAADIIPWCQAHHAGVIVYSPLQAGLLTSRWTVDRVKALDPEDWRPKNAEFQSPALERNLGLRDRLQPIAERHQTSVSSVAIAWLLAWPGVTAAIVGGRSPQQIDDWVTAMEVELSDVDLEELAIAIRETGAGAGPDRPTNSSRL